jgi:hypothetical protein
MEVTPRRHVIHIATPSSAPGKIESDTCRWSCLMCHPSQHFESCLIADEKWPCCTRLKCWAFHIRLLGSYLPEQSPWESISKQQDGCAHIIRPASSCTRNNIDTRDTAPPCLPHVIFPRLQAVKLAIIVQYYTPLQGQDTIIYGKIAVPAPPPSGAAIDHLGLVGLRGKAMRSTAWLLVYHV